MKTTTSKELHNQILNSWAEFFLIINAAAIGASIASQRQVHKKKERRPRYTRPFFAPALFIRGTLCVSGRWIDALKERGRVLKKRGRVLKKRGRFLRSGV